VLYNSFIENERRKIIVFNMIINYTTQFLHIPRTGGTFLSYGLQKNNNCCHYDFGKNQRYKECEVPHLNMFENNSFFPSSKMFKTFTIVRDPVERFISCLKNFNKINNNLITYMFKNEINFFNTVNNLRREKINSNWFEPQINFLEYDTKIWKFEKGFNQKFHKWLMKNFNLKFKNLSEQELKMFTENNNYKHDVNLKEQQKQYIKNYYFLDYKL